VVSAADTCDRNLHSLNRSGYFFLSSTSSTHEFQWTPFQTHYFSENLVALGIEPGPMDLKSGTLTTGAQRR
jgi:hypothetical protein